jgi:hypothetical protein
MQDPNTPANADCPPAQNSRQRVSASGDDNSAAFSKAALSLAR